MTFAHRRPTSAALPDVHPSINYTLMRLLQSQPAIKAALLVAQLGMLAYRIEGGKVTLNPKLATRLYQDAREKKSSGAK